MSYSLERTSPESVGISSDAVIYFIDTAKERGIAMHSLMVLRHGKAAVEAYWKPYSADTLNHVYSFSKTLTSAAIGFAVDEGLISLDDKLCSFFPRYMESGADEKMFSVTIEHLLTMTSGMVAVNEITATMKGDWVRSFLNSHLSSFPGDKFCYNSINTYMLAAVLRKVSGVGLIEYLTPRLFDPLGIKDVYWDKCPMGRDIGGWGLHIRTEDMAKFGQLLLCKGKLGDRQILPEGWVENAACSHTDSRTDSKFPPDGDCAKGYGYQIWVNRDESSFRADGMLGQFAIVLPELDSVIVTTAGNMDEYAVLDLIWEILIPAIGSAAEKNDETEAYNILSEKVTDLCIVDTDASIVSILMENHSNVDYLLPPNRQSVFPFMFRYARRSVLTGIDYIRFVFGDECSMSWAEFEEEHTVPLVFDGCFHETRLSFFGADAPCSVYSNISETSPGIYTLEVLLSFTETPHSRHMFFVFEDNQLSIRFNELPNYVDLAKFASDLIASMRTISPHISKMVGKIAETTIIAKPAEDDN